MKRSFYFVACILLIPVMAPLVAAQRSAPKTPTVSRELELQILLDRAGFSPGEIDGAPGKNGREALAAFRAARMRSRNRGGSIMKALGAGTTKPFVTYTITNEDTAGPFNEKIPDDMMEMAKLPGLYYTSVLEELGEKFHSAPALLKRLNPDAHVVAGEEIRVPNVLSEDGSRESNVNGESAARTQKNARSPRPVRAVKVVVSKSRQELKAYGARGQIIFYAPVTSGSEHDPLPLGDWKITAVQRNPTFNYNPDLFWDADPADAKAKIAAGPNNPVGLVWMEINKPHYGIHGTPEPGSVGHTESHGCVRMTNWDALHLADLVKEGTPVVFVK